MIRIPLARRLAAATDATWLIGQFARLPCDEYFSVLDSLLGDTDFSDDISLTGDCQLAAWVTCGDTVVPDPDPVVRAHLLYRCLIAPFAKLKRKGEKTNHE